MEIDLMFHDDWELNGDGSGDINKLMFEPACKVMDLCDKYGAKYTFFTEIGQQFAMLKSDNPQHKKDAKKWENILIDAVKRGHDVQLHFHPIWINAFYENSQWQLDYSKWSISRMEKDEIIFHLKKGKDYFENLLKPYNPEYKVVAFRSGCWMVQPSFNLISALKELNITSDVTVIKGMKLDNSNLGSVDFSLAPSEFSPWIPDNIDILKETNVYENFFCIPTYGKKIYIPTFIYEFLNNPFSFNFIKKRRIQEKKKTYKPIFANNAKSDTKNKPNGFWGGIFKERIITCDFGSMHYNTLLNMLSSIKKQSNLKKLPFIMLTHSKSFYSYENFEKLLQSLAKDNKVNFKTTQSVVEILDKDFRKINNGFN